MSFFNDFINAISIDDLTDKVACSLIFDYGIKINADFKIEDLQENEIILKYKKRKIKIMGKGLRIISLSKGELEIQGKVEGVVKYD